MASELNINTQFLKNLESANNHLKNIVQTTEQATKAFKDLVSGTSAFDVLAKIQAGLAKMSGQKVKVDIEAKGLEELSSGMSDTIKQVQILKDAELFDNSKLQKTSEIVFSIEKKLADTQIRMDELRKKWNILSEGKQYTKTQNGIEPLDFVEPTNDKGRKIRKDSNVYKQLRAEYDLKVKLLKEEVDAEVRQQIELQAIHKKELEWAKMTMAERAEYVQKELNKILKEEQKNIDDVRKLYLSSPEGALKLASGASTINEMKEAQKYLQIARGNVDVKDTEAIKKLNDEYTRLRMTIESLTTAEKNEQSLQPTLKNEYARLLVELDKIAEAKERASKTQAFKDGNQSAQQEMNSLIEREKDIREKMAQIEKAAVIKSKERIKLEKELAFWTAERANYEKNTNARDIRDARLGEGTQAAKDFLFEDSQVAELQAKLNAVEENESALDDIIRKHESNRAMASIALTEKTEAQKAEIAHRILKEKLAESSKYGSISSHSANRMISVTDNSQNVAEEERAIKKLEEARKNLNKNDVNYNETLERLNKKIDEHTHKIKMATDAQYRENHAKEEARKRNTTFEGAMEYSKNTQSINEQIQALKYLKEARANLNKNVLGEEEYRRQVNAITEEIKQQEKELDSLTGKTQETNGVMSQLANRLVAAFSINAISNYVEKIATIRGEFELQKKALTAIIQDQRQANVLWEKTVALAVKSPFRVKELVTYTKQLAAYRVESDKLYDTTKMLADISAGLGVDMDRLILAYGQVKAANYLRGTELRQFSEAGVNILQELSTYYEKTRGVAVSVAEVFDMVSKRKVAFEDVHAVLQNLTSAGGMFFEMQEKQASTLQGQISNLRDAYELMLNDIGKENEGLLKGGVMLARTLISNWKAISTVAVPAIEIIAVGMAAFKIRTLAASKNMAGMVAHMKSFGILLTQGKAKMKAFAAAAQINPFGAWAIAIGIFVAAISGVVTQIMKIREAYKKINDEQAESEKQIKTIHAKFIKASGEKEPYKAQREALHEIVSLAKEKYQMKIDVEVDKLKVEELGKKMSEITQQMLIDESYISEFKKAFADREENRFNPFGNEIVKDLKQYQDAEQTFKNLILTNLNTVISTATLNYEKLNEAQRKVLESLKKRKLDTETNEQYIKRLQDAYNVFYLSTKDKIYDLGILLQKNYATIKQTEDSQNALKDKDFNWLGIDYDEYDRAFISLSTSSKEAQEEVEALMNTIKGLDGLTKDQKERIIKLMVKTTLDSRELQGVENKMLSWIEHWNNNSKSIKVKIDLKQDTVSVVPPQLAKWQEEYNKKFKGYHGFLAADASTEKETIIAHLKEEWEKLNKEIERYKKSTEKEKLYSDVDISNLGKKIGEVEKQLDAYGEDYTKKTTGGGTQKNWFVEMAKSIRDTHNDFVTFHKDLEKSKALAAALDKNKDVFAEAAKNAGVNLSLDDFTEDFDKEKGVLDMLEKILEYIPEKSKNARYEVEKLIRSLKGEEAVKDAQNAFEELSNSFDSLFGEYELTLNLKEAGFNSDWIEGFFKVPNTTLNDIRAEIRGVLGDAAKDIKDDESLKKAIKESTLDDKTQNELLNTLKKITEEERKALQKRLEQYIEYSTKNLTTVSQIRLKEAQELHALNEIITAEIERVGKETEAGMKLAEVLKTLSQSIKDTANSDVISAEWDEFKSSESFIQFFEDAEFATTKEINNMLDQLEKFRKGLVQEDDVELMRAVVKEMEKLKKIKLERAPFMAIINAFKDLKDYRDKSSKYELSGLDIYGVENKSGFKSNKDIDNSISQINDAIEGLQKKYKEAVSSGDSVVATSLDNDIKKLKEGKEGLEKLKSEGAESGKTLRESFGAFGGKLTEIGQSLPQFQAAFENMGIGFSQGMKDAIATTSEVLTGVGSAIQGFESGNYLQGVLGVVSAIGSLFQIGDKRKERQIQREIKFVEKLSKEYEKLEESIDEAYSTDTLKMSYDDAQQNLEEQIAATERMIELEKQKKKTDDERIKQWEEENEKRRKQQEELMQQEVEKYGGNFDVRSVAEDFVNAWLDAFKETGDGLKGLEENFKETMKNIAIQQAVMGGVGNIIKPLQDKINDALEGDFTLNSEEMSQIDKLGEQTVIRVDDYMKKLFGEDGVFSKYLDTEPEGGELTGLQKGIQGVTEETAQIIEGYLNSIRFFVAEKYRILSEFISSFSNPEIENPIVSQLKIIARNTTSMEQILSNVVLGDHSRGGYGLKVFID